MLSSRSWTRLRVDALSRIGGLNRVDALNRIGGVTLSGLASTKLNSLFDATSINKSRHFHTSTRLGDLQKQVILGEWKSRLKQARRSHALEEEISARRETLEGSRKVVMLAMLTNSILFSAKLYSAILSGSSSMFSEALHSLADVMNESLLLLGIQRSLRVPDQNHPYGFTSERYAWALVSGVGVFFLGGGVSIYHGISGIVHPHVVGDVSSAVYVLGGSLLFEMTTMFYAYRHISESASKAGVSFFEYLQCGADPTAVQVFMEDVASVAGVAIATLCLSLAKLLNNPMIDALGSVSIGVLLSCVAIFLIRRNIASLVEQGMDRAKEESIVKLLESDPIVISVQDVKSASIGPEWSRFKAEILFNGEVVTRRHLESDPKAQQALLDLKSLPESELHEWYIKQGGRIIAALGPEVDRLELNITAKHPEVKHIDLEIL